MVRASLLVPIDGKNVSSSHIFKSKIFGGDMGGAGPGT